MSPACGPYKGERFPQRECRTRFTSLRFGVNMTHTFTPTNTLTHPHIHTGGDSSLYKLTLRAWTLYCWGPCCEVYSAPLSNTQEVHTHWQVMRKCVCVQYTPFFTEHWPFYYLLDWFFGGIEAICQVCSYVCVCSLPVSLLIYGLSQLNATGPAFSVNSAGMHYTLTQTHTHRELFTETKHSFI